MPRGKSATDPDARNAHSQGTRRAARCSLRQLTPYQSDPDFCCSSLRSVRLSKCTSQPLSCTFGPLSCTFGTPLCTFQGVWCTLGGLPCTWSRRITEGSLPYFSLLTHGLGRDLARLSRRVLGPARRVRPVSSQGERRSPPRAHWHPRRALAGAARRAPTPRPSPTNRHHGE